MAVTDTLTLSFLVTAGEVGNTLTLDFQVLSARRGTYRDDRTVYDPKKLYWVGQDWLLLDEELTEQVAEAPKKVKDAKRRIIKTLQTTNEVKASDIALIRRVAEKSTLEKLEAAIVAQKRAIQRLDDETIELLMVA